MKYKEMDYQEIYGLKQCRIQIVSPSLGIYSLSTIGTVPSQTISSRTILVHTALA